MEAGHEQRLLRLDGTMCMQYVRMVARKWKTCGLVWSCLALQHTLARAFPLLGTAASDTHAASSNKGVLR